MSKLPHGASLTNEDTANMLENIAERIANGERSFDLQLPITTSQETLIKMRHIEGLKLLNRISLLLNVHDKKGKYRYEIIQKTIESLPPLDPDLDCNKLRELANEIRSVK